MLVLKPLEISLLGSWYALSRLTVVSCDLLFPFLSFSFVSLHCLVGGGGFCNRLIQFMHDWTNTCNNVKKTKITTPFSIQGYKAVSFWKEMGYLRKNIFSSEWLTSVAREIKAGMRGTHCKRGGECQWERKKESRRDSAKERGESRKVSAREREREIDLILVSSFINGYPL